MTNRLPPMMTFETAGEDEYRLRAVREGDLGVPPMFDWYKPGDILSSSEIWHLERAGVDVLLSG